MSFFAQSLVEHGALDSLSVSIQRTTSTLGDWLGSFSPTTWLVIGGVVVAVLVFWGRSRQ